MSVVLAVSCGGDDSIGVPSDFADHPPDVTLRSGPDIIAIGPHSYSAHRSAADGTELPPDGPTVVVEDADVTVDYPIGGWTLVAQAAVPGGATTPLTVEQLGPNSFHLVPPTAGTYDVWLTMVYGLSGNNVEASAGYVFRWIVPPT